MRKLLILMMISSNLLFANVNGIVDKIILHEGSGVEGNGLSKYGVTLETMKAYKLDVNGDSVINKKDVYSMTKTKAKNFYKRLYAETFPHEKSSTVETILMPVVFDSAVNLGSFFAKNTLVKATNSSIASHKLKGKKVNYVTEKNVFQYLNGLSVSELKEINNSFVNMRISKYVALSKKPKFKKYKKGWIKRVKTYLLW